MKAISPFIFIVPLLAGTVFSVQAALVTVNENHSRHERVVSEKSNPIDINHADASALEQLKGIGPKRAKSIISYREKKGLFKSLQDLFSVPGMSKKSVNRLIKENPNLLIFNP